MIVLTVLGVGVGGVGGGGDEYDGQQNNERGLLLKV